MMNHSFLITAYKDIRQLIALVESLNGPRSHFYIAIDRRSELARDPDLVAIETKPNVSIERSIAIHWGGFSHLRALLSLCKKAAYKGASGYFHALSGQCFPIVAMEKLEVFFEQQAGLEFIECKRLPNPAWNGGGLDRIGLFHLNDIFDPKKKPFALLNDRFLVFQKRLKVARPALSAFPQMYGGGTWWSLSDEVVRYILAVLEDRPYLLAKFRHSHCSEEILFHSIIMNSPYSSRVAMDDLRYVDWNWKNGSCPAILDERDLKNVTQSGKIFARKLDSTLSAGLIRALKR